MAIINDLIEQVKDKNLREKLSAEFNKLSKQKKFGLVFEEHIPECTPLWDMPVAMGSKVALKTGKVSDYYIVSSINDDEVVCIKPGEKDIESFNVDELVVIAEFGEAIYPYLKQIDSLEHAPDSELWHTLIEADNYHALQLLEYLYAGKVDCIYIDPPYNTGARDWKYNNDYVDSSDSYRHSKWLSFMEKRLRIAKQLLNPTDSVLIITIDEKEYLHLGMLLEEMFPEARIQMISDAINPKGVARSGFSRNDEYLYVVMFGTCMPARLYLGNEWSSSAVVHGAEEDSNKDEARRLTPAWTSMMRRGSNSSRSHSPGCYYPIYANPETKTIEVIGEPIPSNKERADDIDGLVQILPVRTNGELGVWQVSPSEMKSRMKQGRIRLGRETSYGFVVNYLPDGAYKEIVSDGWTVEGFDKDGSIIAYKDIEGTAGDKRIAPTQWKIASHNASENGSTLIQKILGNKRFTYPKSLYSTHDAIRFFVADKPNARIVDFFAGSGTTLHAVNLLNAADGGSRECIIVTNNEVSDEEAKALARNGYKPGDEEWERLGIARYVTWPRTVCSIEGHDINGNPLKGNYIGSDIPMADGFKANAAYFKLGFLDKNSVSLGKQFKEMLPLLWMKAGTIGQCPVINGAVPKDMLLLPENKFAVLIDEKHYMEFVEKVEEHPEIDVVYIITDSESGYRDMIDGLSVKESYQLYRDYLDNFRINSFVR